MSPSTAADAGARSTRSAVGRPLDSSRDDDLRQAALELVAEIGYDRLTIDAVAARVKASKATVYRRWSSKAELVADAFASNGYKGIEEPDTGDLREDLVTLGERIWVGSEPVPRSALMAGMLPTILANPELREALSTMSKPPATMAASIIQRAAGRGDIPPPDDLETLISVIPGMCMFRLLKTGTAPDRAFFETVVDVVILPALRYNPPPAKAAKKGRP